MRRLFNFTFAVFAAAALAILSAPAANAQSYPSKPIRMIVPTPAGSIVDLMARVVGENLTKAWGQQVIIVNVGGAGGTIGVARLAGEKGDGYTLGFVPANLTTHPSLFDIKYDVRKDFTPISQVAGSSMVFYASNELGANSVKDVIAMAKAKPGVLTYASAGGGSIAHMAGALFNAMAGVDIKRVPYRKFNLGVLDVVKGRVSVVFVSAAQGMKYVREGKLKVLGISSKQPNPGAPGVKPISDLGLPGFEVRSWFGVIGPKGVPEPIVNKIHGEVVNMSKKPEFQAWLAKAGAEPIISTPAEFRAAIDSEIPKWADVVKRAGAKAN